MHKSLANIFYYGQVLFSVAVIIFGFSYSLRCLFDGNIFCAVCFAIIGYVSGYRLFLRASLKELREHDEPEYICQNEAFRRFGRSNVTRWRDTGKIEPCKRTQKLEYKVSELRRLQDTKQDYFR